MKDSQKALPAPKSLTPYTGLLQGRGDAVLQELDTEQVESGNERFPIDRESIMTHGIAAVMGFVVSLMFYLNGSTAVLNATAMVIMFAAGVLSGGFIAVRYFKIKLKNWRKQ